MSVDRLYPKIAELALGWYYRFARTLPWRMPPGSPEAPDPYRIWLAEIMLQQTTVTAAAPYWQRFLELWPSVQDLAAADDGDVMREWAGLGYYARARNLLAAARTVADLGAFPTSEAGLLKLPGVGPYTAAAVAAIAFQERATVIDANIERVASRLFALETPLPAGRPALHAALHPHVPADRPGDFAQALMDIGSSICTPKSPHCLICPLQPTCAAFHLGTPEAFPKKAAKAPRPVRRGLAWIIQHENDVALVRRPPRGLLGGMIALPGTQWGMQQSEEYPFETEWKLLGSVRHVFTHFELNLKVAQTRLAQRPERLDDAILIWTPQEKLGGAGLPTLYARAVSLTNFPEAEPA